MIDDLAEAILNRIFSDERFGALKRQSDFKQVDEKIVEEGIMCSREN